ncbi:TetR/AcrR family transcriptional regulator [Haloactinomyces albus]|uniref:AcrR family transcriptional regulator n=1 Tax=Haloactinomyces albus TaxID=1352928 RepID=A0AAE4CPC4_9ACTN|nr:TetR/AcrR family transcriptional regulator [Haloactinomyces albus]MDR7302967.1 AcrR family transcriptional regulator [Haloactinomyces albus]
MPPRTAAPGDTAPAMGRRERKKLATRTAVREAALHLSLRHGVENVTVEQISAEADIALRTFFNHYSSKEEAVVAVASAGAEALIAEFRARPRTESVLQAIREAVLVVMDQSDAASRDHVEALRLIRQSPSLVPQQLAVFAAQEKALADAITERIDLDDEPTESPTPPPAEAPHEPGSGRSAVYPGLCAAAALTALRVVLDRWLDQAAGSGDTPPMEALRVEVDRAITELAAGLDRPGPAAAERSTH